MPQALPPAFAASPPAATRTHPAAKGVPSAWIGSPAIELDRLAGSLKFGECEGPGLRYRHLRSMPEEGALTPTPGEASTQHEARDPQRAGKGLEPRLDDESLRMSWIDIEIFRPGVSHRLRRLAEAGVHDTDVRHLGSTDRVGDRGVATTCVPAIDALVGERHARQFFTALSEENVALQRGDNSCSSMLIQRSLRLVQRVGGGLAVAAITNEADGLIRGDHGAKDLAATATDGLVGVHKEEDREGGY